MFSLKTKLMKVKKEKGKRIDEIYDIMIRKRRFQEKEKGKTRLKRKSLT